MDVILVSNRSRELACLSLDVVQQNINGFELKVLGNVYSSTAGRVFFA